MSIPNTLFDRVRQNEIIAKKFHDIEINILTILNFQDFIEKLLSEISSKFLLPYTWVSIIEESSISKYFHDIKDSQLLGSKTAFLSITEFTNITHNSLRPLLSNEHLNRFEKLIPKTGNYNIGSIAIAPITMDGQVVGSFNQADQDVVRFAPGIDTSLLEQLAIKVSLCLSNVTAHEKLKFLAFHDPLTKLINRRVMEKVLEREFQRSKRYNIDLSVLFLDLDNFKSINDTYGHDIGDITLCHVADCLNMLRRDSDIVARFAGDEFVAILPSTNKEQAKSYINRVDNMLSKKSIPTGSDKFFVKISHGLAFVFEEGMHSAEIFLKVADKRLLLAKNNKKP